MNELLTLLKPVIDTVKQKWNEIPKEEREKIKRQLAKKGTDESLALLLIIENVLEEKKEKKKSNVRHLTETQQRYLTLFFVVAGFLILLLAIKLQEGLENEPKK